MTGSNEKKLVKGDYTKTMIRAWLLQNGFNYSNYQGNGYSYVVYPALKKIHGSNKEALCKDLADNCEFYNTNPNLLPFVTSLHLAMADEGVPYSEIRGLKMALMGPLAGIGDSLSQFCFSGLLREHAWRPRRVQPHERQLGAPRFQSSFFLSCSYRRQRRW